VELLGVLGLSPVIIILFYSYLIQLVNFRTHLFVVFRWQLLVVFPFVVLALSFSFEERFFILLSGYGMLYLILYLVYLFRL